MVLALALPLSIQNRQLLVTMTFGVVLLSILIQGSTMSLVLRKTGLVSVKGADLMEYEELRVVAKGARAALSEIAREVEQNEAQLDVVADIQSTYQQRLKNAESKATLLRDSMRGLRGVEQAAAEYRAVLAEKSVVTAEARAGHLSEEQLHGLIGDIDQRLAKLQDIQR
jgi:CPA1 family monovalent cation:H+ antiporter